MLKALHKNEAGYILWESLISFLVLASLLSLILPLIVFVRQQQLARNNELELARYAYEISQEHLYLYHSPPSYLSKKTDQLILESQGTLGATVLPYLQVNSQEQVLTIELIGHSND